MAWYFTRQLAGTQATTTYSAMNTAVDGSTAGSIRLPAGPTMITKIKGVFVTDGGHVTITGIVGVLKLSGAALVQGTPEVVINADHMEDGGGALTYTSTKNITPTIIPTQIPVKGGNDLTISCA